MAKDQAVGMFESLRTTLGRPGNDFDHQAQEARERSLSLASETMSSTMSLASETMSNTLNFVDKLMRAKEPREIIQLQSEFIAQQGRTFAEYSNVLGENIARKAEEALERGGARDLAEVSRRAFEAA